MRQHLGQCQCSATGSKDMVANPTRIGSGELVSFSDDKVTAIANLHPSVSPFLAASDDEFDLSATGEQTRTAVREYQKGNHSLRIYQNHENGMASRPISSLRQHTKWSHAPEFGYDARNNSAESLSSTAEHENSREAYLAEHVSRNRLLKQTRTPGKKLSTRRRHGRANHRGGSLVAHSSFQGSRSSVAMPPSEPTIESTESPSEIASSSTIERSHKPDAEAEAYIDGYLEESAITLPPPHENNEFHANTDDPSLYFSTQMPQESLGTTEAGQTRHRASTSGTVIYHPPLVAGASLDAKKLDSDNSSSIVTASGGPFLFL